MQIEQVPPYVVWPIRHQVMYPKLPFDTVKLAEDYEGMHLALFDDNKLISVLSVFRRGPDMQFRKFATLNEFQGKGYGSALMEYIITMAKQENMVRLWCNARRNAAAFYKTFGFQETENTFFKDGYEFVVMELMLGN